MIERATMNKSWLEVYVKLLRMAGKIAAKSWISKNAEKCQKNRNSEKKKKNMSREYCNEEAYQIFLCCAS